MDQSLGKATILALLAHNPSHIYFSGRSGPAAGALIASVTPSTSSPPPLTFVQMDLASLATIRPALAASIAHDRLDVLVNNAGIMTVPRRPRRRRLRGPVRHQPTSQPRPRRARPRRAPPVVLARNRRPPRLRRPRREPHLHRLQSRLANILFTRKLARRHPSITSVVGTGLLSNQGLLNCLAVRLPNRMAGAPVLTSERGCWSQVCAPPSRGLYMPVGRLADDRLDRFATDEELARELWRRTEGVSAAFD
ncbi:hypothetical protein LX36DRAFT_675052 [Colletotrichum falcatum]|nr:hypothetical protein LX36DRAFT_675052 [Colletotrichum falcatum]